MIYGINFNGTEIPLGIRRKFAKNMRLAVCSRCSKISRECGCSQGYRPARAELKGIGQSEQERDAMLVQMNNGKRTIHVEKRLTVAGYWFGIYEVEVF